MTLLNRNDPPNYGADVPISMPQVSKNRVLVPMYGFGYNKYGICHDISQADLEELSIPRYRPYDPTSPHNKRGDEDLDG